MGPVVSEVQFDKIQGLIQAGIDEGATLVTGGPGRPEGLKRGYYVRPTVFGDVTPDMTIATGGDLRAGAVDHPLRRTRTTRSTIANDTVYGLAAYVQSQDIDARPQGRRPAARRPGAHQLSRLGRVRARSAATSSRATAANTPTGRSTIFSRSRASSATGHRVRELCSAGSLNSDVAGTDADSISACSFT